MMNISNERFLLSIAINYLVSIVSELDKVYRVTLKSKFRLCIKKMQKVIFEI